MFKRSKQKLKDEDEDETVKQKNSPSPKGRKRNSEKSKETELPSKDGQYDSNSSKDDDLLVESNKSATFLEKLAPKRLRSRTNPDTQMQRTSMENWDPNSASNGNNIKEIQQKPAKNEKEVTAASNGKPRGRSSSVLDTIGSKFSFGQKGYDHMNKEQQPVEHKNGCTIFIVKAKMPKGKIQRKFSISNKKIDELDYITEEVVRRFYLKDILKVDYHEDQQHFTLHLLVQGKKETVEFKSAYQNLEIKQTINQAQWGDALDLQEEKSNTDDSQQTRTGISSVHQEGLMRELKDNRHFNNPFLRPKTNDNEPTATDQKRQLIDFDF